MQAQGILASLGTFLTRLPSKRESEFARESSRHGINEGSREKSGENDAPRSKRGHAPTRPELGIRSADIAAKAQSSEPAMVNPGPVLALLMMLRSRRPPCHRNHARTLDLPSGCVLAARYASR